MGIDFLNKVNGMWEKLLITFFKRISFWDILKWNGGPTIWNRWCNIYIFRDSFNFLCLLTDFTNLTTLPTELIETHRWSNIFNLNLNHELARYISVQHVCTMDECQ